MTTLLDRSARLCRVTAALRPEEFAHPRCWNKVPWPQRHAAFDRWFATTRLNAAYAANPATAHLAIIQPGDTFQGRDRGAGVVARPAGGQAEDRPASEAKQ